MKSVAVGCDFLFRLAFLSCFYHRFRALALHRIFLEVQCAQSHKRFTFASFQKVLIHRVYDKPAAVLPYALVEGYHSSILNDVRIS